MKMNELFRGQLETEAERTRRALERTPEGQDDWKPHEKSMPFGRLAMLVARMPSWLALIISRDELDLNQFALRRRHHPAPVLVQSSLGGTTDEDLLKPWRLLVSGRVVSEEPRQVVMRDTFTHLAHHRGQLTVYLRLNEVPVPAIYGPSADEARFD